MKNRYTLFAFLVAFTLILLQGCSFIGDIFKAGVWIGVIIVVVVVLIIILIISKIRNKE